MTTAGHNAGIERVATRCKNDWYDRCRSLGGKTAGRTEGNDDVHILLDQPGRELVQAIRHAVRVQIHSLDRATLHVTKLAHSATVLLEIFLLRLGSWNKPPDPWNLSLCTC